jgi:hypothetical protein
MRARTLIVAGTVALTGAAAIVLLMPWGTSAPYSFLGDHTPLPQPPPSFKVPHIVFPKSAVYSFQADYDAIVKAAGAELKPLGFKGGPISGMDGHCQFASGSPFVLYSSTLRPKLKTPPSGTAYKGVHIQRDSRYMMRNFPGSAQKLLVVSNQPGWVAVTVFGEHERTDLLSRVRSWLGL